MSLEEFDENLMECDVSHCQRQELRDKLMDFRSSLCDSTDARHLYVSQDVSCGLPVTVNDVIVENCHIIHSVEDLEELCGTWYISHNYANY